MVVLVVGGYFGLVFEEGMVYMGEGIFRFGI